MMLAPGGAAEDNLLVRLLQPYDVVSSASHATARINRPISYPSRGNVGGVPGEIETSNAAAASGESSGGSTQERRVLRTRTVPAGPHPYLDRLASGMHRPFEGDDSSWRKASIQPVPIPDLGHTGIRTKFSPGTGGGFAPDGAMTRTLRADIHDVIRNLPRRASVNAQDVRVKDYDRATRRHRLNPCGGSMIDAHMASLELGGASSASLFNAVENWGWDRNNPPLHQSSTRGEAFRSGRLSPSSSPLSSRRALARYVDSRGGVGEPGVQQSSSPAETRKALLFRELSRVKMAATGKVYGENQNDEAGHDITNTNRNFRPPAEGHPAAVVRASRGVECSLKNIDDGVAVMQEMDWTTTVEGRPLSKQRRWRPHQRTVSGADERPEDSPLRERRGRQEVVATDGGAGDNIYILPTFKGTGRQGNRKIKGQALGHEKMPKRNTGRRAWGTQRRLRKPFSADSLFDCLLDVRYGDTAGLSPGGDRATGKRWDLTALPAGVVVPARVSAVQGHAWNGFDGAE